MKMTELISPNAPLKTLLTKAHPTSTYGRTREALQEIADYAKLDANGLLSQATREAFRDCQSERGMARFKRFKREVVEGTTKLGEAKPDTIHLSPAEWEALRAFIEGCGEVYALFFDYAVQEFLYREWSDKITPVIRE